LFAKFAFEGTLGIERLAGAGVGSAAVEQALQVEGLRSALDALGHVVRELHFPYDRQQYVARGLDAIDRAPGRVSFELAPGFVQALQTQTEVESHWREDRVRLLAPDGKIGRLLAQSRKGLLKNLDFQPLPWRVHRVSASIPFGYRRSSFGGRLRFSAPAYRLHCGSP
jgi:hypothetical protein